MKKVLTQSDKEETPKKYGHGDYDEDEYHEDDLGEEYAECYKSDSYANGDEGEENEDHNLGKGDYMKTKTMKK
jgi:hypothetical protein